MRILHIVSTLEIGGAERLVTDLAIEQKQRGHEPAVCCFNQKTGSLTKQLECAGVPVFGADRPLTRGVLRFECLRDVLRRWPADVVHSHLNFSVLSQALACWAVMPARSSFMVTQHGFLMGLSFVAWRAAVNYRLARPFIGRFSAVSLQLAQQAAQIYGVKLGRWTIIYNGVRVEQFQFAPRERDRRRQELQLPPDAVVWGTVGRLVWEKGYDILLQAFARTRQANPRLHLVLVGAGPELVPLQKLARELGCDQQVTWPGESSEVMSWLSLFDYYTQPSRVEALSLAVLEALANGLPVVAARVGSMPEIAARSPAVELVPSNQVEALCEALTRHSRDAAIARHVSKLPDIFHFDATYASYEAEYQALFRRN